MMKLSSVKVKPIDPASHPHVGKGKWGDVPMSERWGNVPYAVKRNKSLVSIDGGFADPDTKKLKLIAPVIARVPRLCQALSSDRTLAVAVRLDEKTDKVCASFVSTTRPDRNPSDDTKATMRTVDVCAHAQPIVQCSCCFAQGSGDLYCLIVTRSSESKGEESRASKLYRVRSSGDTWKSELVCVSSAHVRYSDPRWSQTLVNVDQRGYMYVLEHTPNGGHGRVLQMSPDGSVASTVLFNTVIGSFECMAARVIPGGEDGFELHACDKKEYCRLVFRANTGAHTRATGAPRLDSKKDNTSSSSSSSSDLSAQLKACEAYREAMLRSVDYQWVGWDSKRDSEMLAKSSREAVFQDVSSARDPAVRVKLAKLTGFYSSKYDNAEKKELYGALVESVLHNCVTGEMPMPVYNDRSVAGKRASLNKYFSAAQTNAFWIMSLQRQLRGAKPADAENLASKADCAYIHSKLAAGKADPDTKRQYYYTRTLNRPFLDALTTAFRGNPGNDFEKWPFNMDHLQVLARLMGISGFPQLEAVCGSGEDAKGGDPRKMMILTRVCKLQKDPKTRCPTVQQLLSPTPGTSIKLSETAQRLLAFKLRNIAYALNCYDLKKVNFALSNVLLDLSAGAMSVSIADVSTLQFGANEKSLADDLEQLTLKLTEAGLSAAAAYLK